METGIHHFARYLALVLRRFWDDRLSQVAASLAFTTLLSLVPLLAIVFNIASAFPAFGDLTIQVRGFIAGNLLPGTTASTVIVDYMQQFLEHAAGLTALGAAILAVTALMLLATIEGAFDVIWRGVGEGRRRTMGRSLLLHAAILIIGPVVLGVSLSVSSYLVTVSMGLTTGIPLIGQFLLKLSTEVVTVAGFSLLYLFLPHVGVAPRHALVGGIVAGVMFEIMGRLFALYIAHFPNYTLVYGAFSAIPIFLLWIYFSWLVVMFGGVITATLPDYGRVPRKIESSGLSHDV
jgi:membrane protein